jgi:cation transport ATPase
MKTQPAVRIPIFGLGCGGGGATTIEHELAHTPGVLRAYVNAATETAYVDYDPALTDASRLAGVIEHTGYHAGPTERSRA